MIKKSHQENVFHCPVTITRKMASQLSGIAEGSLANMASKREGPPFFKRGRKVLYDYENFCGWLKESPVLTRDSIPE